MHLVDPRIIEQQIAMQPLNPLQKSINQLDIEMRAILDRQDISDREKVMLYNQVLQRYLEYKDINQVKPTEPSQSSFDIETNIMDILPKRADMRRKADALMKRIKEHPDMMWNERGEFIYQGRLIPGTNIIDLVSDVLRKRKTVTPHGWQEFARALRGINAPREWIGNTDRWDWMHRTSGTEDAYSTADESVSPSPNRRSRPPIRTPRSTKSSKKTIKTDIPWDTQYK